MDYIAGGTLSQHLAMEGFFSEKVAQFFTAELCLALEYLHGNGIIYRYGF
jgi:serine/threonine protein kinase